jgi:hydrogenase expression/formation protein HypD
MGYDEYDPIAEKYKVPIVVTGFEPIDLLQGIYMAVKQLESGEAKVENQYIRYVQREGNLRAKEAIDEVFAVSDREWRGIGTIPHSGWEVNDDYARYDARKKFSLIAVASEDITTCIAGEIMKGKKKPFDCPHFGKGCTPEKPMGSPMVSSEGACAAYYHFSQAELLPA